jgi:Flp pilus assembly protein TadG
MRGRQLRHLGIAIDGATAVEFALVVLMFLMLVFGAIEIGRMLWTKQALQETAIVGARCMAIAQSSNSAQNTGSCAASGKYSSSATTTYIENVASGWGLSLSASNISLAPSATSGGCTGLSQVTLTSTFTSPVAALILLSAGGITLSESTCYPNNS